MMKVLALILAGLLAAPALTAGDGGPPAARSTTFSLVARQAPETAAERYLFDLAESSRRARKLGYVGLVLGAALTAGGIAFLAGIDDSDGIEGFFEALAGMSLVAAGAVGVIGGMFTLAVASGPERRYEFVRGLSDPGERERASREALSSLSRSGKTKRLIVAGLFSALAVISAARGDEAQAALIPGGLAIYQFLRKSREERAYAAFLATEGVPAERISVGFGPGRHGGLRLVLAASF
jgi:hypothetical protein